MLTINSAQDDDIEELHNFYRELMAGISQVQGNPGDTWDELSWIDMSSAEQALWAALGWNEASWEEETDAPSSDEKYWEDLTQDERVTAAELGYTQASWDEE